ncbi:hypothetical protein HYH03_002595 [Edaphochlamys debaryana]|uniref:Uncharacterized protein n=1 Tax=Edaphochlamys debaryana TaxID=47281 RepID=A0A835YDK6_9CHLO|nr:hypothetical protein HYH03_002595 [Edaphochlamys debaryana]|eukprot:KAG2499657.1 hypothetical protein HYH03_002595 [Edaphochlamys debaryana]
MANITRDRGCAYYVPWLATVFVCFGIAATGVWAYYTKTSVNKTEDSVSYMDAYAPDLNRFNDSLVGTSIAYLVLIMIIYVMCLWRSFIEAAHDATGVTAKGATAFLVLTYIWITCWWCMLVWLVFLLQANTLWQGSIVSLSDSCDRTLAAIVKYGPATWLPSRNLPCPGQCLDLSMVNFLSVDYTDSCICDQDKLTESQSMLQDAYDNMIGVQVGNWVMLAAGLFLLMSYVGAFSHTKRERELLTRVGVKRYSSI